MFARGVAIEFTSDEPRAYECYVTDDLQCTGGHGNHGSGSGAFAASVSVFGGVVIGGRSIFADGGYDSIH
jgi:hypothetical protein